MYWVFVQEARQKMEANIKPADVAKRASGLWGAMSDSDKAPYKSRADILLKEYRAAMHRPGRRMQKWTSQTHNSVKKPPSMYWLFVQDARGGMQETKPAEVAKRASAIWRGMSESERAPYKEKADLLHQEYRNKRAKQPKGDKKIEKPASRRRRQRAIRTPKEDTVKDNKAKKDEKGKDEVKKLAQATPPKTRYNYEDTCKAAKSDDAAVAEGDTKMPMELAISLMRNMGHVDAGAAFNRLLPEVQRLYLDTSERIVRKRTADVLA
jgi:hypothetical protein